MSAMQITPDQYRRMHTYLDRQEGSGRKLGDIVDDMFDEVLDVDVVDRQPRRWVKPLLIVGALVVAVVIAVLIGQATSGLGVREY